MQSAKTEKNMKKELILMMGGQGSGKGTLSKKFLEENKNFKYIPKEYFGQELKEAAE